MGGRVEECPLHQAQGPVKGKQGSGFSFVRVPPLGGPFPRDPHLKPKEEAGCQRWYQGAQGVSLGTPPSPQARAPETEENTRPLASRRLL